MQKHSDDAQLIGLMRLLKRPYTNILNVAIVAGYDLSEARLTALHLAIEAVSDDPRLDLDTIVTKAVLGSS